MLPEQMRAIADVAETYGRGDIRLTAWQNLMIPHIASADLEAVKSRIVEMGFHYRASTIAGGLVACTGNAGCKYAASNTKGHALQLAQFLEAELHLDQPLNIHLTGCHHSLRTALYRRHRFDCHQGQSGGESVEGYAVVLGGGVEERQAIAHEVFQGPVLKL